MARAWADVDLGAIRANVATLRDRAGGVALCAVVKADGYGHGAVPVARAALAGGASVLGVAQVPEARALREAGVDARILLLSEPRPDEVAEAVGLDLDVAAYRSEVVQALAGAATRARPTRVHVKVDTGMHRVGAPPHDVVALAGQVDAAPTLELSGLWTHCAVADEPGDPYTDRQLDLFEAAVDAVEAAGLHPVLRHAANSAAAICHPRSRFDMVRCGIAVYGIPPAPGLAGEVALSPALRLASEVAFVKRVAAGERISYGLRHGFGHDSVVATVPVGYADGVRRDLGLRGQEVLVGGVRRPIVGVVTMDQLMVDCGPSATVGVGDEVVLLGGQGDERISPDEWAARAGTISYEVVCAIGARVERRYPGAEGAGG
ncbi:MAG: alanine racemase [Acidimicrobiia bacterium]